MSRADTYSARLARYPIRDAAMCLARAGVPDNDIRELMITIATEEAEIAIAWGAEEDERQRKADAGYVPSEQQEKTG